VAGSCHRHHISVMELGHLLTRSSLTYPEVSSKVCHNSFCQLGNSVSLPWVIYYEAFYSHDVKAVIKRGVPKKNAGNFLNSSETVSLSRKTLDV
jgi:hypothetical protein